MANFKEGDRVQIVAREQTNDDIKSRSYYPYMRGLRGTIYRLYNDGRAAVQVDLETLPEAVLTRHTQVQERMKNRWLEGLSEEARSRLTPEEREFHLNYVLLVHTDDLLPESKRSRAAKSETASPVQKAHSEPPTATNANVPKRKTLKDHEKAEEEFLKSRQQRMAGKS